MDSDVIHVDDKQAEWLQKLTRQIEELNAARFHFVQYVAWNTGINISEWEYSVKEGVFKRKNNGEQGN